jgi:hypothetical protein
MRCLWFLQFVTVHVHCTVNEKVGNLIETIPPSLWFKKSIQEPQVWELSRLCPETSAKLYFMNSASVSKHVPLQATSVHKRSSSPTTREKKSYGSLLSLEHSSYPRASAKKWRPFGKSWKLYVKCWHSWRPLQTCEKVKREISICRCMVFLAASAILDHQSMTEYQWETLNY